MFLGYFRFFYSKYLIVFYRLKYGKNVTFCSGFRAGFGFKLNLGKNAKIIFGENFSCRENLYIQLGENSDVYFGSNIFFNRNGNIEILGTLKIDSDNLFGMNVNIIDHGYIFHRGFKISELKNKIGKISIGCDNWISSNVSILSSVSVGNNCVISYGSVLKNVKVANDIIIKVNNQLEIKSIK